VGRGAVFLPLAGFKFYVSISMVVSIPDVGVMYGYAYVGHQGWGVVHVSVVTGSTFYGRVLVC
jgi:hypothetical protein